MVHELGTAAHAGAGAAADRPTLLVVDADRGSRDWFAASLSREGFRVATAGSADKAIALAGSVHPSLILLDLALGGADGLALYRRIVRVTKVPVIVFTAGDDELDAVRALEAGAADHVRKPPRPRELAARIRAVLRRTAALPEVRLHPSLESVELLGPVSIDVKRREVLVRGRPVVLARKEFDLLALLVGEAGSVVTRDQCMDRIWRGKQLNDSRTLDTHIKRLRQKIELKPAEPRHVLTVRGVGYRFKQ